MAVRIWWVYLLLILMPIFGTWCLYSAVVNDSFFSAALGALDFSVFGMNLALLLSR